MKNLDVISERREGVTAYIHEKFGAYTPEGRGINKETLVLIDLIVDLIDINKEMLSELKKNKATVSVEKPAVAKK